MTRPRAHSYLLRDTGVSVAFWLVVAVGLLIVVDSVFRGNLWQLAATASVVALVLWALGMVLFHPHVRYDDELVVVTNIARIHELPWTRVVAVRQSLSLTFELDDGRRIRASGVTAPRDRGLIMGTLTRGKLGAGSADFHRYADALRLKQDGATTSLAPVVSHWDLPALAIGAVLALAVVAVSIVGAL
jgi:lysylphosphatidylglycerol synthetase-like protein (DUF2156 family)